VVAQAFHIPDRDVETTQDASGRHAFVLEVLAHGAGTPQSATSPAGMSTPKANPVTTPTISPTIRYSPNYGAHADTPDGKDRGDSSELQG